MGGQQFQSLRDAGGAGVIESRGFHFGVTSPAGYRHFLWIRRRQFLKVKIVYRVIISMPATSGLVIIFGPTHVPAKQKACPWEEQTMKLGFFTMPIHPV